MEDAQTIRVTSGCYQLHDVCILPHEQITISVPHIALHWPYCHERTPSWYVGLGTKGRFLIRESGRCREPSTSLRVERCSALPLHAKYAEIHWAHPYRRAYGHQHPGDSSLSNGTRCNFWAFSIALALLT